MDSFEINKIIAAVLLIALLVIGIGKISDIAFHEKLYLKFSQFQLQVVQ